MKQLFEHGDIIVYQTRLGMMQSEYDTKFYDVVVQGDRGVYIEPYKKHEGWHLTRPEKNGDCIVPVLLEHIELDRPN